MSAVNGAYETYNSKYSKDTSRMFVMLPYVSSYMTYEVTIINQRNQKYEWKDIKEEYNTNLNVTYQINEVEIDTIFEENKILTKWYIFGGAIHISTKYILLKDLSATLDSILIVAGAREFWIYWKSSNKK